MKGLQEEISMLHKMSAENLLSLKPGVERQQVIDSIIKNVIPIQAAFADMFKHIFESSSSGVESEDEHADNTA